jgi:DHA1 family tetracycline resistance protein-like MFS transporter
VTSNLAVLLVVLAPIALSGGVLNTMLDSQLTKAVRIEEVGGILGLSQALQTLAQMVTPAIGGLLLDRVATWAPGAVGSALMVLAVVFAWRYLLQGSEGSPAGGACAPAGPATSLVQADL